MLESCDDDIIDQFDITQSLKEMDDREREEEEEGDSISHSLLHQHHRSHLSFHFCLHIRLFKNRIEISSFSLSSLYSHYSLSTMSSTYIIIKYSLSSLNIFMIWWFHNKHINFITTSTNIIIQTHAKKKLGVSCLQFWYHLQNNHKNDIRDKRTQSFGSVFDNKQEIRIFKCKTLKLHLLGISTSMSLT